MSNHSLNHGGLQEAKEYMMNKEIPQLFESMMTALMYKKPENHIQFLEDCLGKAKQDPKVRWHSFIEPLPPIPKATEKIQSEASALGENTNVGDDTIDRKQSETVVEKKDKANSLAEQVFKKHMDEINSLDDKNYDEKDAVERPWYADYTEKNVDTSVIQGKPIVFVLGGPGSGKGTQCAKIVEKYGFLHLSAGDLLRAEVKKGSDIGSKIDQIIKEGQLVPQDVTICLLKEAMVEKADSKGFLIDGFPREIKQGKQFERQVAFAQLILNYECPDDVLTSRLMERGKHSGRVDDNVKSIKKRLNLFHAKTRPVIEHYSDIVANIQANRSIDEVFEDTCKALQPLLREEITATSTESNGTRKVDLGKPIVFVLGAEHSGRKKQCEMLSHRYSLNHISLEKIEDESQLGVVPMEIALDKINRQIHSNQDNNGFLIDGFPRNQEEAICFEMQICPVSFVMYYECPDDVIIRRHMEEENANEEEAKKGLEDFHSRMTPLLLKYPDRLKIINCAKSEDIVFKETCDFVDFLVSGQQQQQPAGEDEITPERQQEIESAVQDIVDFEIAPQQSDVNKPVEVEGEEDNTEVDELAGGDSGSRKHVYQEMLKNKKIIYVAGTPGSGKSTQCKKLVEGFGLSHISKDILLREVEAGTERGLQIAEMLKRKENVPDKLAFDILGDAMLDMDECKGFLLEGYPANVEQAKAFEEEFKLPDLVLFLTCPEEISSQRFLSRGQPGDTHENYEERLTLFKSQTAPLIESKKELLREIDTTEDSEVVFEKLSQYFKEQKQHQVEDVSKPEEGLEERKEEVEEKMESKEEMTDLSNKNIIFVLGGPGSGKGTQCAKIVEKYGFCHLSTGDLLRAEVNSGSERAAEMKEIMAKGELIPLETILTLLREAMLKNADCKGFLIDGYPRDVPQGEQFEQSVGKCKFIIYFHCTNEVMTERLLDRAKSSGRVDDNEETIKLRLKTFENQTLPVLDKFADRVKKIDAMRGKDDIFADVCKELDTL